MTSDVAAIPTGLIVYCFFVYFVFPFSFILWLFYFVVVCLFVCGVGAQCSSKFGETYLTVHHFEETEQEEHEQEERQTRTRTETDRQTDRTSQRKSDNTLT